VLFLGATGTAALHNESAQECREASEPAIATTQDMYRSTTAARTPATFPSADANVRRALDSAGLPAADLVATGYSSIGGSRSDGVFLFAREHARRHVTVVSSTGGPGLLVPQRFATSHKLHAGSSLTLGSARVTVAGVYRDIAPSAFDPTYRLPRYWCAWKDAVVPTLQTRPPPMLLTDIATLRAAVSAMDATWYVPRSGEHSTIAQMRHLQARTAAALAALAALGDASQFILDANLGYLVNKAERERAGLSGGVIPIDVAGTLVAALLVAAAGKFWGLRRQRELVLLTARGIGRFALGVKAVLETGPAILLGTVAGWLVAIGIVRTLGPTAQLEPGTTGAALGVAALAGVGALVAGGVSGAAAVKPDRRPRGRPRWARRVPWELALLAASAVTYQQVRARGAVRVVKATVQINPLVLAFPLLALTGAVLLLARGGTIGLRLRPPRRLPGSAYLAFRRLAGTPAIAVGVLVGVAVPIGVLVYSAALSGSTAHDVQRKYETDVGAPSAFGTLARRGSTPELYGAGTVVSMIQVDPRIDDGTQVRVLALDPSSFLRYAFEAEQLRAVVGELAGRNGPAKAILVNAPVGTVVSHVDIRGRRIPLHVIATRHVFPGLRDPYSPLLVVNRRAFPTTLPAYTDRMEEIWTDPAHEAAALAALARDHVDPLFQISPDTFLDNTGLRPVTWIFGYLRALAYLAGLVAVTALAFAFTARTRRWALSYYLSRRMGLTRAGHRRSIAVELGTLLTVSWVIGVSLAVGAVAMVYRLTDAYPAFPPAPQFPMPSGAIVLSAMVSAVVALLATVLLQRVLDRIAPAELLRAP
jgi:putative ABC transport system permease protein